MRTAAGDTVWVLHPGREHGAQGPDLLDGSIWLAGSLMHGPVELHLRSSAWTAHGHHQDPRYDQVVLHVVLQHDTPGATSPASSGAEVAIVPLGTALRDPGPPEAPGPCWPCLPCRRALSRLGQDGLLATIEQAGLARFALKAARFKALMVQGDPEQIFYEAWMETLGYSENREPFLELARRMPWALLRKCSLGQPASLRPQVLMALLLGAAGLVSQPCGSQHPLIRSRVLSYQGSLQAEGLWRDLARNLPCKPAAPLAWKLCGLRPGNSPPRRMVAAAHFLTDKVEQGLLPFVLSLADGQTPLPGWERALRGVEAGPGGTPKQGCSTRGGSSLGSGRAREMLVNVVLPFLWAWGSARGEQGLMAYALGLYRQCPRLPDNWTLRQMRQQLDAKVGIFATAVIQQGLLHLYQGRCKNLCCHGCPLNLPAQAGP